MFFKSMMSKMQKTWLWVFAGMFLIPEVLWSPVSNLCYELLNNKLITILVLASLILPSISQALIFIPTANITIVVNTQGEDSAFTFNLSDGEQFNLQTENLTTSYSTSIVAFGNQYVLSQENIQGLKIGSINCVSDNQSDIISYTADGVIFSRS